MTGLKMRAHHLLKGLLDEYEKAVLEGRQDAWATAAHNIIDLLASQKTPSPDDHG